MRAFKFLALLIAMAAPVAAYADDNSGFYGSLTGGGQIVGDTDATFYEPGGDIFFGNNQCDGECPVRVEARVAVPTGSDKIEGRLSIKPTAMVGGTVGYDFGKFRTDVEFSYGHSKVRSIEVSQLTSFGNSTTTDLQDGIFDVCDYFGQQPCASSGNTLQLQGFSLRQINVMGNVWADVPVAKNVDVYGGGGLGMTNLSYGGIDRSAFAWQVGAGAVFYVVKHVGISADVRYRQANGMSFDDNGSGAQFGRFKTFSFGLGLRIGY